VKLEEVETHIKQLLERVNIQMLVIGNMYKDVSAFFKSLDSGLIPWYNAASYCSFGKR